MKINSLKEFLISKQNYIIVGISLLLSISFTYYYFVQDKIVAYGDAESHLNIAKRVFDSITPGFAQLGGIWLPLPHILMLPFVHFDFLWRSGLAGSIVSGTAFVVAGFFIFKLTFLFTQNRLAAFVTFLVFSLNPNILYIQATPLTEMPLIAFFVLSTYFFFKFIFNDENLMALILAAFFGFCASLTRYDAWFLILFEALALILFYFRKKGMAKVLEGKLLLFSTLAFFGILLWLLWDLLILGDPLYFTNSEFSAHSQQLVWLARGELLTFHNLPLSVLYYVVTVMENTGYFIFLLAAVGLTSFLLLGKLKNKLIYALIILVPFIFYIWSLYSGQAALFIPQLTPSNFQWNLFNVRYGVMAVPAIAFLVGWLFFKAHNFGKFFVILILAVQLIIFSSGLQTIITYSDGASGLSSAKRPDAERWLKENYDQGLVLMDDYARTVSILRTNIPMNQVIYIGNKPYWQESLEQPEKYATWIVMQKSDTVWKNIYEDFNGQKRLYKYFQKAYTSPDILIFKRNSSVASSP